MLGVAPRSPVAARLPVAGPREWHPNQVGFLPCQHPPMVYWGSRYPRSKIVAERNWGYPRGLPMAAERGLERPRHRAAAEQKAAHPRHRAAAEQKDAHPRRRAAAAEQKAERPRHRADAAAEQKAAHPRRRAAAAEQKAERPRHRAAAAVPMHYRQNPPYRLDSIHLASPAVALEAANLTHHRTSRHLHLCFCQDCGRAEWPRKG